MNPLMTAIETPAPWPDPPQGMQTLARLKSLPLTTGSVLRFRALETTGWLVLASAYDKRLPCRLVLKSPDGGWLHLLDAGYGSLGQRFHVAVPQGIGEIQVEALDEDPVLWVLADPERLPSSAPTLWPAEVGIDRTARFLDRLETDCIAEFGWMGGCVLEAFEALAAGGTPGRWKAARDRWLSNFIDERHLRYQNGAGVETFDTFLNSEALLPMACISRLRPAHPILEAAIRFFQERACREATCEGCYTLAYPLMQIAALRGRSDLADLARKELEHRRERLVHEGAIYLRFHGTHRTYRNWARGVGWYLLGHAECLALAGCGGAWEPVAAHLSERVRWVLDQQRTDGLWSNFFYEPELPPDTAGSAGIAAALLKAHALGLAGPEAVEASRRCWTALQGRLFVDGWLGWTSPSNKRDEAPQHRPQLASETFGMGLMGLLAGTLGRFS